MTTESGDMHHKVRVYSDRDLMKIAIEEHLRSTEFPRVGAVVVKHGIMLSRGHRGEVAKRHAERVAIEKLTRQELVGATIVTTLEPCVSLFNDQSVSSCVDLIADSGIREVVIGVLDPNGSIYSRGYPTRYVIRKRHIVSVGSKKKQLWELAQGMIDGSLRMSAAGHA